MWVGVNSGSWWWRGRPGVLRFMGSQWFWFVFPWWLIMLSTLSLFTGHLCIFCEVCTDISGFLSGTRGKEPACKGRRHKDVVLLPGSGRSPRGEPGNPLQCSCLENPMDRGAWQATVHWVPKSWTRLKWPNMHIYKYFSYFLLNGLPVHYPNYRSYLHTLDNSPFCVFMNIFSQSMAYLLIF